MSRAATVANKPGTPGRERISRNTIRAGKAGAVWLNLWFLPRALFTHGGHGHQPMPGLPCALLLDEGEMLAELGCDPRRENAVRRLLRRHAREGGHPVRRDLSINNSRLWILDHPPSRVMTPEVGREAVRRQA